ncbi:MAG: 4-hydroxy-3-methylbut-2-enyl diphosphate reductase, partial [Clostridia bacterium]|nr:4-hydroxy-3-methylbut-2-enyl diphosphate reductase [Clostridia bacterium]
MEIKLAKTAGFCFGVNRAVDMLYKMVEDGERVCTLGPIIHNPQVIDDLADKGVVIIDSEKDVPAGTKVVIRTHGVEKQVIDSLKSSGIDYCDATCPFVRKIHKIITDNSDSNTLVLIAGDANHPEVQGIRSYCKGDSIVFKNSDELAKAAQEHPEFVEKEIIVVWQTTFNTVEYEKCLKNIKKHYTNAKIFDTICSATNERQEEAMRLASDCDAMIIVGGRQSSNTAKLKAVCENCCPTYLIETAKELSEIDLSGCGKVGVTAGASTPAAIIKEVLSTMSENTNANVIETAEEVAMTSKVEDMDFETLLNESLDNMSTDQKVLGIVTGIS